MNYLITQKKKNLVINNVIDIKTITKMSQESVNTNLDKRSTNFLTVCRIDENKGLDIAVPVCRRLIDEGYNIKWYVLGDGPYRRKLEKLISKYNLENEFKVIGFVKNPYVYIKECDIIVHPSRFEGKSVAIDEAKAMCKPIVITNYTTVKDQIQNRYNGIIVEISEDGLFEGLKIAMDDKYLINNIIHNLEHEQDCNKIISPIEIIDKKFEEDLV